MADHRDTLREHQRREKVSFLPLAKRIDPRIVARTFGTGVPAQVVVLAVSVLFAVGLVVLFVVADEIVQGEPVMDGDEIDARVWSPPAVAVQSVAAGQPRRQL